MTNDEYTSLVAKLGEHGALRCIEILDNYKGANGRKYASDYRAILNWVIGRYEEERQKGTWQPVKQLEHVPRTYEEAVALSERKKQGDFIDAEFQSLGGDIT